MIEADQASEPPPSADAKEVPPAPANPPNTDPLEGWYRTVNFSHCSFPLFYFQDVHKCPLKKNTEMLNLFSLILIII